MSLKSAYIITEGKFDAELVKGLLPDLTGQPDEIDVLAAPGYSAALSIAESVLFQTQRPALLLVDADTDDEMRIREKKTFIEQYVRVNGMTCQVILAVPTMEVVFFADKSVMEVAIGKSIEDDLWTLAKLSPKKGLELLTGKSREQAAKQLMGNDLVRRQMAQTPLMNEVSSFVQQVKQPVSA